MMNDHGRTMLLSSSCDILPLLVECCPDIQYKNVSFLKENINYDKDEDMS